jgi:hypothetical protein
MAQNQNGIGQSCLTQLHGFQHGGYTEEAALALQQPGDLNGAVAVGVGFDDGHNGDTDFFLHGVKIFGDHVQINLDAGAVEIQVINSILRLIAEYYIMGRVKSKQKACLPQGLLPRNFRSYGKKIGFGRYLLDFPGE